MNLACLSKLFRVILFKKSNTIICFLMLHGGFLKINFNPFSLGSVNALLSRKKTEFRI